MKSIPISSCRSTIYEPERESATACIQIRNQCFEDWQVGQSDTINKQGS